MLRATLPLAKIPILIVNRFLCDEVPIKPVNPRAQCLPRFRWQSQPLNGNLDASSLVLVAPPRKPVAVVCIRGTHYESEASGYLSYKYTRIEAVVAAPLAVDCWLPDLDRVLNETCITCLSS